MKLTLNDFSGMVPVLDGHSLPDSGAQIALNCTTESHKVKLRTGVPAWSAAGNLTSDVNGRQYEIDDGLLKEDGVSMHTKKPAAVTLERIDYWTLLRGYTGMANSPRFQLKSGIGLAGAPSTLEIAKFSYNETNSSFIMQFVQQGGYYDAGAIAVNIPSEKVVALLYNGQEYPLQYPQQISISDNDNGVYATVYVDGVVFTTQSPEGSGEAGAIIINTTNIFVRGKLIKNKSRRNYVVTYWDGRHESPPSDVSAEIDVCKGDTVKVTIHPYVVQGNETYIPYITDNAAAYYIYRTGGSLTSSGYYFVEKITVREASGSVFVSDSSGSSESGSENHRIVFTDTTPDYLLQEQLSVVESPLTGMKFLHFFNGSLVAAKDNHVYFSEPSILYNWPSKYEYSFADEVIGLTVSGNTIIVFVKDHAPSMLRGTGAGVLTQTELQDGFTCVSADSVCQVASDTYYAAAEGLAVINSSGQYKIITTQFFSKAQWTELNPETMKCSADNFAIRLYLDDDTVYIFDLRSDGMVLSKYDGILESSPESGSESGSESSSSSSSSESGSESGSSSVNQFTWKTKVFTFPVPVCFRIVRATTADGTGTFTVYAGHNLSISVTAPCSYTNGRAVRLRPIFAREWCFQVQSTSDLLEIEAAESPAEMY